MIKKKYEQSHYNSREHIETELKELESALSTKLPDETYHGIINLERMTIAGTPIDEIEKALVSE